MPRPTLLPVLPLGQPPLSSLSGLGVGVVTLRSRPPNCACTGAATSVQAATTAGTKSILRIIRSHAVAPGWAFVDALYRRFMPFAVIFINTPGNLLQPG